MAAINVIKAKNPRPPASRGEMPFLLIPAETLLMTAETG